MEKEKKNAISEYENYFKDEMEAIESELKKSKEYSEIIDTEIKNLRGDGAFGVTKGGQHYLIEHISNAVQLQSQRQSLQKDKLTLKKLILDYANKDLKNDKGSDEELSEALAKFIENSKKKDSEDTKITLNEEDLDSEIDLLITNDKKEDL